MKAKDDEESADSRELDRVESDSIPEAPVDQPFLQVLLSRMNPASCLVPVETCGVSAYKSIIAGEREEFEWLLPGILEELRPNSRGRTAALQRLYRLTDREHKPNRVPAVCTTKFETIQALGDCLDLSVPAVDRRQALLILNNLCIPNENKAAILFGEPADELLSALLAIMRARLAESYLAICTLVNLSYLKDEHAKTMLLNFVPEVPEDEEKKGDAASTYRLQLPADDCNSLIRTLDSILQDFVPVLKSHPGINSVEQQCCRWSMNVIRNLVSVDENAFTVATKTTIPAQAAHCLSFSCTKNLQNWTRDSMEDAALMVMVNLARLEDCLDIMKDDEVLTHQVMTVCDKLVTATQGIHQTRAKALLERFEEEKSTRSVGYSV